MGTELLDGDQVVALLWSCFNPTRADRGVRLSPGGELLGELDAPIERDAAIQAGLRLREAIASSSLDFDARLAPRARRPRCRADDRRRDDRRAHEHGLAARGDADAPAVHAKRVRARARTPPRATEAQARLPPAVYDQPRCRIARASARLRPLRAGARVRGTARPARDRPADRAVSRLDLREAPRPRPRPRPCRPVRGGRLLRRADRVSRRLQGQRRHLSPAAAVGEHAAAGTRRARPGAQVPDRQRRRHAAAGRDQVRIADRDPVRVRRPGPHRRAAQPLRRAASQPHAADQRQVGLWKDDERQRADVPVPGARRARVRDRPRRPLRNALPARGGSAADRDRRRGLPVRAEPVGRARSGEGAAREGRVSDRASPGDDGPPGRAAARDARLRDPGGVRESGRARRAPDRVAVARGAARAGRRRAESRRPRDRRDAAKPRRPAV